MTNLILLQNNLDHFFVSSNVKGFESFCNFLAGNSNDALGVITHWQEFMGQSGWKSERDDRDNYLLRRKTNQAIGTTLVTKRLFESWWLEDFTEGKPIIRPDNPFGPNVNFPPTFEYLPMEEFFRHSDGYGHIQLNDIYASPIRPCCTLVDSVVSHADWSYGIINKKKKLVPSRDSLDFQLLPKSIDIHNLSKLQAISKAERLLTATSYRFSFSNSFNIFRGKNTFFGFFTLILISFHPKRIDKIWKFLSVKYGMNKKIYIFKRFILLVASKTKVISPIDRES
jgi:hypothetical protein